MSRRLRIGWLLWCVAVAMALAGGTGLPWAMRLCSLLVLIALAWRGDQLLRRQKLPSGDYVCPDNGVRRLGSLFWLRLSQHSRSWVVLDAGVMEPDRLAALKGSLKLVRHGRRSGV